MKWKRIMSYTTPIIKTTLSVKKLMKKESELTLAKENAAKFSEELPLTLLNLMARAMGRADTCCVVLNKSAHGLSVHFSFAVPGSKYPDKYELYLTSTAQDVQNVIDELTTRERDDDEVARLHKLACDTYDMLTPEQRTVLNVKNPY